MFGFISRRIAMALVVMFVVALISFLLFRFVGDPVNQMVGIETTPEQREALRQRLGLNDPILVQFFRYILGAIQFDFGNSYQFKQPVADLIGRRLPATLELSFASAIFALLFGIPMGIYTGLNRDSLLSKMFLSVSLVGIALPTFFIGILFIFFFSVTLQWLPSFGRGEVVALGSFWDTGFLTISGLKAIILPAITLGLYQMTLIMRLIRAEMLEVMRTDHIKFARARGLPNRSVYYIHALKNTMVPVITITGLQLGSIIAFAIITETVFQWPGMGILFLQAVQNVDIPIMAAYLLLTAFIFVFINLIVDILYVVIDPRLRTERGRA
ncbi:ABC transporter permease [Pseudovibrio sp. Ad37]|uniref:ABC transporter permease n=1 Tax=Pseudovibrio sp. Ad37 TaxID=989422 RepID=UPI0007AE7E16|nr:ABC transporter permease [Pseudovibrio sp. Ad37]KZL13557.1 Dipeptide transport system permease protein DppB [Pseudovibrio sp. Ad37]